MLDLLTRISTTPEIVKLTRWHIVYLTRKRIFAIIEARREHLQLKKKQMENAKYWEYFEKFENEFRNKSLKELKSQYLKYAHQYHPDKGGDNDIMKALNKAYETALGSNEEVKNEESYAIEKDLMEKIQEIMHIQNINIEVMKRWIWVTGDTKPHKEELKKKGFFWAWKKQVWYYRSEEDKVYRHNREYRSLDQIRQKYGSQKVKTYKQAYLHA